MYRGRTCIPSSRCICPATAIRGIQTGPIRFLTTDEKAKAFRDSLDIPEGYKLLYIIAIGYPDESPDAKPRDAEKIKFIK